MNEMNTFSLENLRFANELWIFLVPGVLMAIDVITGSINAWAKKDFKSNKMRQGLVKKCGEITILAIGTIFKFGFGLPWYLVGGLAFYIIVMELIIICENLDAMGVPIPKFISKALANARKKYEGGEKNGTDGSDTGRDDGGSSGPSE